MAENLVNLLLTATARPRNQLHAVRAAAGMTVQCARMATGQRLLARAAAAWCLLTASDGRVYLGDATWTVERITRVDFARLAQAEMAEFIAQMDAT